MFNPFVSRLIGDANISAGVMVEVRVEWLILHTCVGYGDRRNDVARGFAGYWNRANAFYKKVWIINVGHDGRIERVSYLVGFYND